MASFDHDNASASTNVSVRPATRLDLDGLRRWGRHREPYLAEFNVPPLTSADLDELWELLSGRSGQLLYHGFLAGRLIAQIKLRDVGAPGGSAELGITMDPSFVGRGLGRVLLTQTLELAFSVLRLACVRLDVAAYNRRAIAAYSACGFRECTRRWVQLDSRTDFAALLRAPEYAWIAESVRIENGITRILILAMEARHHV